MVQDELPRGEAKYGAVRQMFDRIAPRYDLMNRLLTGGLDQRWRRRLLAQVAVGTGDVVVDVACGTGDLAELGRQRGAFVLGVDFAFEMLRGAARRQATPALACADAARLPLPDACATVVTCGFALRNFVALPPVFSEIARVLRAGGRLAILEVDRPDSPLVRGAHSLYFDRIVPQIGALLSDRAAYRYLPQSTAYLPPLRELAALLAAAGFESVHRERLLLGTAQMLTAVRSERTPHR